MENRKILNMQKVKNIAPYFLIVFFLVVSRLIPHLPNFTPVAAVALFGGVYLDKKFALIVPLIALFISDIFLGFHSTMIYVYLGFLITGAIGMYLKNHKNIKNIFLATIFSSILFFIITNFGVFLSTNLYPKNLQGLINCYVMAIPFFRNTLLGDMFYVGVFFASFEFILRYLIKPSFKKIK